MRKCIFNPYLFYTKITDIIPLGDNMFTVRVLFRVNINTNNAKIHIDEILHSLACGNSINLTCIAFHELFTYDEDLLDATMEDIDESHIKLDDTIIVNNKTELYCEEKLDFYGCPMYNVFLPIPSRSSMNIDLLSNMLKQNNSSWLLDSITLNSVFSKPISVQTSKSNDINITEGLNNIF